MINMKLNNGLEIPVIGLGIYKMLDLSETSTAIETACKVGYRLLDTAQMYKNEHLLGESLKDIGINRQNLFIISKVDNPNQGYDRTISSFYESLDKIKTTYLDSFLVHWPGQDKKRMIDTWAAMEHLYENGLVKSIGVCNFEKNQLEFLLRNCKIKPMINQIEHNPYNHNVELINYCQENDIRIMAWGPLLRGNLNDELIQDMSKKYEKSPAQLLLRWNVQQGIIPIPKSKNANRQLENISIFDFMIDEDDMLILNSMDKGLRTSHDPLTFDF